MSTSDIRGKRTHKNEARKLITQIVGGSQAQVRFSRHALEEMEKDELTTVDIWNVLKSSSSKIFGEGELVNGTYRYRLETKKIMVVVSFDTPKSLVVVTAWRK